MKRKDKNKVKNIVLIGLIVSVLIALFFITGLNKQVAYSTGTYIQAPTFYYYECSPSTGSTSSTHVPMTTGDSGWIVIPSNTDTADLIVSQTEQTAWYSMNRRMIAQVCHDNGAYCDTPDIKYANEFIGPYNVPSIRIYNLLPTDKVRVQYQYSGPLGLTWTNQPNGAEWYHVYKPFILWKVDMFNGGKTEYTSAEQGCNFLSSDVPKLIDSTTNINKQLNEQTTTSDTKVPFYKTRNFIGTYAPISIENVNFVNYNGVQAYCLQRQLFSVSTIETNGGTLKVVDSNFNTRVANSVTCCPGETEPTRTCNSNFEWQDKSTTGSCSAFKACAGADWQVSTSKTLIRYNCVNTQCIAQTKTVDCTYNSDCGVNQICDTLLYKCVNVAPGTVTCGPNQTLVNNACIDNNKVITCTKFWQGQYERTPNILEEIFTLGAAKPSPVCRAANWFIAVLIFGGLTIILMLYLFVRRIATGGRNIKSKLAWRQ